MKTGTAKQDQGLLTIMLTPHLERGDLFIVSGDSNEKIIHIYSIIHLN